MAQFFGIVAEKILRQKDPTQYQRKSIQDSSKYIKKIIAGLLRTTEEGYNERNETSDRFPWSSCLQTTMYRGIYKVSTFHN